MKQLEKILGSKTKIALLRIMSQHKDWEYSITELSKDIGLDKSLISKTIRDLEKQNLVKTFIKGNTKLCRINSENKIVKELIIELFEKEENIDKDLSKEILKIIKPEEFPNIISLVLYGSIGTENFTLNSDIDIMIIVENQVDLTKLKERVGELSEEFMKFDLFVSSDILEKKDFKKLFYLKEPAIVNIVNSNIKLYGKDIEEIL